MLLAKNITVFITTVQEGSLLAAAKKLFTSPPPLSRSIRILEDELGVKLFDRVNSRLKLTKQGYDFYKEIFPIYKNSIDIFDAYKNKKNKIEKINLGTHQISSRHASFLCDFFIERNNYNIELKEYANDFKSLDVVLSAEKIEKHDFDVELSSKCKIFLCHAAQILDIPDYQKQLKNMPFIQSSRFIYSDSFRYCLKSLRNLGYKGDVLHVDDLNTRYHVIKKGGAISLVMEGLTPFNKFSEKHCFDGDQINRIDFNFIFNYLIYFKSSITCKDELIRYIKANSHLLWLEK